MQYQQARMVAMRQTNIGSRPGQAKPTPAAAHLSLLDLKWGLLQLKQENSKLKEAKLLVKIVSAHAHRIQWELFT